MKRRLRSPRSHRAVIAPLVTALTVLALVGASPSTSAEQQASTLRISPDVFVGGQALRFVGSIEGAPNSKLRIQTLTNRTGDAWETRDGFVATTNSQGEFDFVYQAPNNFGIAYRAQATNGATSPSIVLEPRQQEVVLSLNGGEEHAPGIVAAGEAFTIDVNTTPTGRGDLGRPAPAFPGRELALQRRVGDEWTTVDVANASERGTAQFVLTVEQPGRLTYRVRQDDIRGDGNQIGWFPSFPLDVTVVGAGRASRTASSSTGSDQTVPTHRAASSGPQYTATPTTSSRYQWGPTLYDFAWVDGEALTDPPYRGTKPQGRWLDASDGSGRASHYNGGMALKTHVSEFPGNGDYGTTSATLEGNPITYGRWEFRRRIDVFENTGRNYRVKIDLVPEQAADARCGGNTINVANVAYNSARAKIGVTSGKGTKEWSGSRRIPRFADGPHSFGVEVTRDHISWFLDGRTLATVTSREAIPGVPLTPRLSLVGQQSDEMRRTRVLYDWQRGWPLNKQAKKAQTGPGLNSRNRDSSC